MGKFLGRRELKPGEKIFGGKGSLIPFRFDTPKVSEEQRVLDPNDPLHSAIESVVAGLSPKERVARLDQLFPLKQKD